MASLDKALGFAGALFNALEAKGHRVILAPANEHLGRDEIDGRENRDVKHQPHFESLWSPYRPTVVYVGTVAIGLSIIEMSEPVLMRYVNGNYVRDAD